MENWQRIYNYHSARQDGICAACGKPFTAEDLATIQHKVSSGDRDKFPLFMDSILNTCLIHLSCNVSKNRSHGRISHFRAGKIEDRLRKYPGLAAKVNLRKY